MTTYKKNKQNDIWYFARLQWGLGECYTTFLMNLNWSIYRWQIGWGKQRFIGYIFPAPVSARKGLVREFSCRIAPSRFWMAKKIGPTETWGESCHVKTVAHLAWITSSRFQIFPMFLVWIFCCLDEWAKEVLCPWKWWPLHVRPRTLLRNDVTTIMIGK